MKYSMKDFSDGVELMLRDANLKTVTIFCSPLSDIKQRIRISRPQYKRKYDIREGTLIVSYGRPNYAEREYIILCKKAKSKPRKLWLKYRAK